MPRGRALLLLGAVALIWGLTWPVNKAMLQEMPPLLMLTWRSVIATIVLFAMALPRGRLTLPPREDMPVLLSITVLHMVGFTVLAFVGLSFVSTGRSVVLSYTTPLWVMPGAALFLKEKLSKRRALGVGVGLTGLVVLFNPLALDWSDRTAVLGNLALLGAAFLWAGSILHIRGHVWRSTPFQLIPWEALLATVLLAALAFVFGELRWVEWHLSLILLMLFSAVIGNALSFWAIATAGRGLSALTISLGLLMTPLVSIVTATLALGEPLTLTLILAAGLILGGVALGTTGEKSPA